MQGDGRLRTYLEVSVASRSAQCLKYLILACANGNALIRLWRERHPRSEHLALIKDVSHSNVYVCQLWFQVVV